MAFVRVNPEVLEALLDLPEGVQVENVGIDRENRVIYFGLAGSYQTEEGSIEIPENGLYEAVYKVDENHNPRLVGFDPVDEEFKAPV